MTKKPSTKRVTGDEPPRTFAGDGHDAGAKHQADNLGTGVLHGVGAMQTECARRVAQKAGDAKAHVARVAALHQHDRDGADNQSRQHHQQGLLVFHMYSPLFCGRTGRWVPPSWELRQGICYKNCIEKWQDCTIFFIDKIFFIYSFS